MAVKKLIEVALPLEKINASAAYEKMPGIGAHPRGLHLWWARRPFTAARAVIWASLIDDPSSHPELFPTEEEQIKERARLFRILEELSDWKNSGNEAVLNTARAEIMKATDNNPPMLLDPFAGGGAIPLEAMRLGLSAYAHDLNPVAVLINKSMIEIPSRFMGHSPAHPFDFSRLCIETHWDGVQGLVDDFKYYSNWIKQEAFSKVGHLYPDVQLTKPFGNGKARVIAWLWARTVKCPNPACGCETPLFKSAYLSKKKGKTAWVKPIFENKKVSFTVVYGGKPEMDGCVSRKGAICACCGTPLDFPYIRDEGKKGNLGVKLLATVAENKGGRIYLSPDLDQSRAANVPLPDDYPDAPLPNNPRNFNTPIYGLDSFAKLFTHRQLTTLTVFSDLIQKAQKKIETDAIEQGFDNDHISFIDGGKGARAYSEAVCTYLAFAVDRLADFSTSVSRWAVTNEKAMNCFSKQSIPMTWDYPEVNIFGESVGSFSQISAYIADCIQTLPNTSASGCADQHNAQTDCGLRNIMVSTDPPYYDNINYAECADFFYMWLRRSLKGIYPGLLGTMMTPKVEELVANTYRFDGDIDRARSFFEDGMLQTCKNINKYSRDDIPVTIYYAYKQSETDEDDDTATASTGWETMLSAIVNSGFSITGTWPMRTEQTYRAVSMGANALASSIVLVCRKRSSEASICTRRNFINELKRELRPALKKLQSSNIAPVDLAQSAIGPGMGVFSKYSRVLEADGKPMTVRSALQIINQELDLYFNEQDSDLDSESRFCVDLYSQFAFNEMPFGDANTLATAKNTSVAIMASHGTLYAQKGKVHLIERAELPERIDEHEGSIWLLCQQLTYKMEKEGVEGCAKAIYNMFGSNAERAKDLAYRLYTIAERKRWAQEAYAYNALVVAWPEIQSRAAELKAIQPEQLSLMDFLQ